MNDSTLSPLARSFRRHLRAENRAQTTIETYLAGIRQAETYLQARGKELATAGRADLEAFIGDLLGRRDRRDRRDLLQGAAHLYAWLVEEQEIHTSPMAHMKPPIVPEQPVPVVPDDGLRRLLKVCEGRDFEARRDTAISCSCSTSARAAASWQASSSQTWTWTWRSSPCWARDAGPARSRSATGQASRWTATFAPARVIVTRALTGCGSAREDASPTPAWRRCFAAVAQKPACQGCTRTSFATRSPISGSPRAGARPT
jgi:hypothetical protein